MVGHDSPPNYLDGSPPVLTALWRELFYDSQQYLWFLAPEFDMRRILRGRRAALQQLLDAFSLVVDQGLGVALRAFAANIDDYEDGALLHALLSTLCERVVVTPTHVELIFGILAKCLPNTIRTSLGLTYVCAKFTTSSLDQAV